MLGLKLIHDSKIGSRGSHGIDSTLCITSEGRPVGNPHGWDTAQMGQYHASLHNAINTILGRQDAELVARHIMFLYRIANYVTSVQSWLKGCNKIIALSG